MSTPEGEVLKPIMEYLEFCMKRDSGIFFRRINNMGVMRGGRWTKSPYIKKGNPDIWGIVRGKPCVIEVKAPGKGLSKEQEDFKTEWIAAGGLHLTARSIKDVEFFLAQVEA